jgi:hypothetical protein
MWIREVRKRYRVSSYLMAVAALWVLVGGLGSLYALSAEKKAAELLFDNIARIGVGIGTAAFAVQLATYRCPVCDRRLGLQKNVCPGCGIKVR